MSGKNIIFTDKKIKKDNFYKNKKIFKMHDIHVDKILLSKKESYGTDEPFKFFIGYSDNGDIKPLFEHVITFSWFTNIFSDLSYVSSLDILSSYFISIIVWIAVLDKSVLMSL